MFSLKVVKALRSVIATLASADTGSIILPRLPVQVSMSKNIDKFISLTVLLVAALFWQSAGTGNLAVNGLVSWGAFIQSASAHPLSRLLVLLCIVAWVTSFLVARATTLVSVPLFNSRNSQPTLDKF